MQIGEARICDSVFAIRGSCQVILDNCVLLTMYVKSYKTGDTCPAYAKKVRKKFGEYRFELSIKLEYAEKDGKLPVLEPLFKVQLPGDLPSKSVFKCSNFLLSWRRIL